MRDKDRHNALRFLIAILPAVVVASVAQAQLQDGRPVDPRTGASRVFGDGGFEQGYGVFQPDRFIRPGYQPSVRFRQNDGVAGGIGGGLKPPVGAPAPVPQPREPGRFAPGTPAAADARTPHTEAWLRFCRARYRSFNPATGTYRGHDGRDRACVAP